MIYFDPRTPPRLEFEAFQRAADDRREAMQRRLAQQRQDAAIRQRCQAAVQRERILVLRVDSA